MFRHSMSATLHSWAALFDWDGVIVDSSGYHELSWEVVASELRLPLPPGHFKRGFGRKNEFIIPEILGWARDRDDIKRLADLKEEAYRRLVREKGLEAMPGVMPWLQILRDAGIPCVIGSSTERKNIEAVLDVIGCRAFFRDIVSGDDVKHGKPDPEIFLLAAQRAGVAPKHCVVFEDAHVGIEAARAGGMKVVAVTTTHPREELKKADRIVDQLDELTLADMVSLTS